MNPHEPIFAEPSHQFPWYTATALVVAIAGNIIAPLIPVLSVLRMPIGSSGRLMGESAVAVLVVIATFIVAFSAGMIALTKERRNVIPCIAIFLSMIPFVSTGWVVREVAEKRSVNLED